MRGRRQPLSAYRADAGAPERRRGDVGGRTYGTRMIECGSCGTDALVLDRSGAGEHDDDLVVLCAECAPGEITATLTAELLAAPALEKSAHARAA